MRTHRLWALALTSSLCLAFGVSAAKAAWNQPVGGPSPINQSASRDADEPELIEVGGVPYVAWHEDDGTNWEVRVSRLNAAGTAWEPVVAGPSPVNRASDRDSDGIDLAAIGGVPHVAWTEWDGVNWEVRVARLKGAGTEWEEIVGGPSPINRSSGERAYRPKLADVDGVAHVAWIESDQLRVARLNAAGTAWELVGGPSPISGAMAIDASLTAIDGVPHVAWYEQAQINHVRVARLNDAGTVWERLGDRLNHADAIGASLTAIGGVPHVAWAEYDDGHRLTLRVARLDAAGTAWQEIVGGAGPINHDTDWDAFTPEVASIGGVPYVAWAEPDGDNDELRVSRLNAAGTAWEEVVGGASPINHRADGHAFDPSLLSIGGVPYVAWRETDGTNLEIRVSRLEPEFLGHEAIVTDRAALLFANVRTYGVAYPIAFEYGTGSALDQRTATTSTTYGADVDTLVRRITGLTPATDYSWRAIGFDGLRPTGAGPTQALRTASEIVPGPPGPVDPGPVDPPVPPSPGAPGLATLDPVITGIAGRRVTVRYMLTRAAAVTLSVRRCGGKLVAKVTGIRGAAGLNKVVWGGRIRGARPRPGCYRLTVKASAGGPAASDRAKLRLTRRVVRRR